MPEKKAWVVTVDMGYGHQRAAYPLKDVAFTGIITANSDKLLSKKEARIWQRYKSFYEGISRLTGIPLIGRSLFNIYDKLQSIAEIYPARDLSRATFPVLYCEGLICKKKLNYGMFMRMKENKLPVITTFFYTALAAEYAGIENVYCIATDSDINRIWVAKKPADSKIIYFAPTSIVAKRLRLYGVKEERIIETGFPLPKENIGGEKMPILKKDLGIRLPNLDPNKKNPEVYDKITRSLLGKNYSAKSSRILTLTFAVGGAGAQTEIGVQMLNSLKNHIEQKKIKINLAVGTRPHVLEFFKSTIKDLKLENQDINLIFGWNKAEYFEAFNNALRTTDILWTKPSELSFYTALGIPIIIAPPIGSQEYKNQAWLLDIDSGINQEDPKYTHEWLFDLINSGKLCDAAMRGFIEAPKLGTYKIEKIVFGK